MRSAGASALAPLDVASVRTYATSSAMSSSES